MDDAIIRDRAEHGEEGTDAPVGRGRILGVLPKTDRATFPKVYVSTSETNPGAGRCGLGARAGAGQHGTSGPGVLAQHSKIRSAVSTWQLAMLT